MRRFPVQRRGNTVIEAALVLPILLLLAFGTAEFGHFFYVKNNLQGAAREGARVAILAASDNSDVSAAVSKAMQTYGLAGAGYTIITTPGNLAGTAEGTAVSVSVECNWGTVGIRPMRLIPTGKTVKATVTMRREG